MTISTQSIHLPSIEVMGNDVSVKSIRKTFKCVLRKINYNLWHDTFNTPVTLLSISFRAGIFNYQPKMEAVQLGSLVSAINIEIIWVN